MCFKSYPAVRAIQLMQRVLAQVDQVSASCTALSDAGQLRIDMFGQVIKGYDEIWRKAFLTSRWRRWDDTRKGLSGNITALSDILQSTCDTIWLAALGE